ncbi:hypothetical protein [Yoonia sp. 208BN28-4]|uniref:hypothetical protein n=1 Tax=Yoonia sp. 208BN28-4 TaxID=3126505 RepID=UPI00309B842C
MHILKALRLRLVAVLSDAAISVDVDGVATIVTVATNPPSSGWQDDDKLPGVYCFVQDDEIKPATFKSDDHLIKIDLVMQAKGGRDAAVDQLDDMQLPIEQALAVEPTLGGLCISLRAARSRIQLQQGEVVFGARVLTYEAKIDALRADPSIS